LPKLKPAAKKLVASVFANQANELQDESCDQSSKTISPANIDYTPKTAIDP
jgi:hypothetical protein